MNIVAITRFKHGGLFALLRKAKWSQSELARRAGIWAGAIGRIVNLQRKPTSEQANAIQRAFAEAGIFCDVFGMWPEVFVGLSGSLDVVQSADVPLSALARLGSEAALSVGAAPLDSEALERDVNSAISTLEPNEQYVIVARYLRNDFGTLQEVGDSMGLGCERVRQIEAKSLRKLRHPSRITFLRKHYKGEDPEIISYAER